MFMASRMINQPRIIGSLVMRNEMDRYLKPCITWAQQFLDNIFVYDDRSTDGSDQLTADLGCVTVRRREGNPSFLEHEGDFRFYAWLAMQKKMKPKAGDWIFSFDADEFLVSEKYNIRNTLEKAIFVANKKNAAGVVIPFSEIFKMEDGEFYARTDGYWGKIRGPRLFRYEEKAMWRNKAMGCGSEPLYVSEGKVSDQHQGLNILHLGYARDEDKQAKYDRYNALEHGHNDKHIQSILDKPTLVKWEGSKPDMKDLFT